MCRSTSCIALLLSLLKERCFVIGGLWIARLNNCEDADVGEIA